ncbi:hypothetical protein SKAU_G00121480 [Synaphobranchus kaupii]|uniref:PH domain-containing protein n=1 Tax=Synaphobranchus kaupii TaxID=118154 RepID=A0A9Q1J0B0_SYNKA|nr:hypothetical protein SKAU_G00121480 [Synaphobranchus kaupii]
MTRLDPSPHRLSPRAWSEEPRGREHFSRHTGGREREGESGYLSLRRAGSRSSVRESSPPPPYRHSELGHPLPSTRSPEPKACIPFRNPDLGVPSKRRNSGSSNEPLLTSPSKYSQHSNFRRGPRSPSPYTPSPHNTSPTPTRCYSHSSSNHQSRHSSSSHRRGSVLSHSSSPSRSSSPFRQSEYSGSSRRRHFDPEDYSQGRDRERGSPSHNLHGRGLDSEKLYKNLNSIASSGDFNQQSGSAANWKSSRSKTEMNGYSHGRSRDSRNPSPSRRGCDTPNHSLQNKTANNNTRCDSAASYSHKSRDGRAKTDPGLLPGSWGGSTHSLCSPALSRGSSPHRRGLDSQLSPHSLKIHPAATEANHRSRSISRRVLEARSPSSEYRRSSYRNRSPSPRVHGHTSSQSSLESEACRGGGSGGSDTAGMMEEYVVMADIPQTKPIYMREGPRQRGKSQSHRTEVEEPRESSRYSHTTDGRREPEDSRERGRGRERGRDRRERRDVEHGRRSRAQSTVSHHSQSAPQVDRRTVNLSSGCQADLSGETLNEKARNPCIELTRMLCCGSVMRTSDTSDNRFIVDHPTFILLCYSLFLFHLLSDGSVATNMTPDLLNFKKGWMSKLEEDGEWKKHWFVLTDTSLRYYRDSEAEERDDLDGELSLQYCVKVSECDVQKNYGFQIQTREAVFTLSAVTSGIRRNWVEVIRKTVLPGTSPEITQLPDSSSEKDTSLSRPLPSRRRSSRQTCGDSGETANPCPLSRDYAELALATVTHNSPPANESELEEGASSEQQRRLEDRTRWFQSQASKKAAASSPWDTVVLKKGHSPPFQSEEDIERRWAELERQPLREAESAPLTGTLGDHPGNEALQTEVETLRQQLVSLQGDGDEGEGGQCGLEAPCGRSLEVLEKAHRQALEELQKQHVREIRELEREKERLLREETQATVQAMEALKKAHREELERELESVRRQIGGGADTQPLHKEQRSETEALQRELDDLSERYSQKCLELNRAEQSSAEREREISRREREVAQLRKENQELQSRLTEEISRMCPLIAGQGSGVSVSLSNHELSSCDLEMLLRVKENELQYLHREISCLRDELHSLNKEKRSACDRYKEVYVELGRMKSRSEQEIEALKEHLKLAMAALLEEQQLENNLEH